MESSFFYHKQYIITTRFGTFIFGFKYKTSYIKIVQIISKTYYKGSSQVKQFSTFNLKQNDNNTSKVETIYKSGDFYHNQKRNITFDPDNLLLYKYFLVRGGEGGENISYKCSKYSMLQDSIKHLLNIQYFVLNNFPCNNYHCCTYEISSSTWYMIHVQAVTAPYHSVISPDNC